MNEYGLSMNVLRMFQESTRAYFELVHKPATLIEQHPACHLVLVDRPARLGMNQCNHLPV